jgi:hypothetical protein
MKCGRWWWSLLIGVCTGCSTHPLVDFCDLVQPGKMGPNKVTPYGGVGIPQGAIVPATGPIDPPPFPGAVISGPIPAPPGGGIIPGPAPLPGNPGFQLQPPLPPDPPRKF